MTHKEITRLSPSEALALREKADAGDARAQQDWILYAGWKHISLQKGFSRRAKVSLFLSIAPTVKVSWQTI